MFFTQRLFHCVLADTCAVFVCDFGFPGTVWSPPHAAQDPSKVFGNVFRALQKKRATCNSPG